ncbi:MAG: hypothetical protein JXB48_08995 [Candidatus Latescibacteria bacterium]|nr:hypothetical protein [Candidatus Latescibacterota bacterium]
MARKKKHTKTISVQHPHKSTVSLPGRIYAVLLTIARRKDITWILLLLTVITIAAYYPDQADDYDTWWHLKYGEYFVTNGTWNIDHSSFSWTPSIAEWKKLTWLGSSLIFLAYKVASYQGLHVLRLLIFTGIVLLVLLFKKRLGESFDLTYMAGLLLIAVAINPTAIYLKPEMFTILFFAAIVYVYFTSKLITKNLFYVYPFIFVLWMNTHAGYVVGLVFITGVLTGEATAFLFFKHSSMPKELLVKLAVFTVISYAVLILNPYGITFFTEHIGRISNQDQGVNRLFVDSYINRWQYLFPKTYVFRRTNTAWILVCMEVTVLAAFLHGYLKKRYIDITVVGMNIVFFYFSMKMARGALYFPFIWFFSVLYLLKKTEALHLRKMMLPASLIVIIFCLGICNYNTVTANTYTSWFSSNFEECVPEKAVGYIMEHNLPNPLFNDYLSGGYMIWAMYPRYKVFIDPRYQPYVNGVWQDFLRFRQKPDSDGLNNLVSKYSFKTALIHHVLYNDLVNAFATSPDWELVFVDEIAAVFLNKSVIDTISVQDIEKNTGAEKFEDITNPRILYSLFGVYLAVDSKESEKILHYYKNNVSQLYGDRKKHIAVMDRVLTMQSAH